MPKLETLIYNKASKAKGKITGRSIKTYAENIIYAVIGAFFSSINVFSSLTPFGLAFYASQYNPKSWFIMLIGAAIGGIFTGSFLSAAKIFSSLCIFTSISMFTGRIKKSSLRGTVMGGVLFAVNILLASFSGLLLYDIINGLFEAVLCLGAVVLFDKAKPLIINCKKRKYFSTEEIISVTATVSLFILSLSSLPPIFEIKISNVLSILLIFMMSQNGSLGVSVTIAVVVGAINSIGTYNANAIMSSYVFSGLSGAMFSRYSKAGISLGFLLANAIMTVFLNGSTEVLINVYEILFASLLFFVLPQNVINLFSQFSKKACSVSGDKKTEIKKVQKAICDRLNKTSRSFEALSNKYLDLSNKEEPLSRNNIITLFNKAAGKVCLKCGHRYNCWQKDYQNTYKHMFTMLDIANKHGYITKDCLPLEFSNKCLKPDDFVVAFNDMFDMYMMDKVWTGKINESRYLVSEQMSSVSDVLDAICTQVASEIDYVSEDKLKVELDKNAVNAESVLVFNQNDNYSAEIELKTSDVKECIEYEMERMVSQALSCNMRLKEKSQNADGALFIYGNREDYSMVYSSASDAKHPESVNGDSHTALKLKDGKYVLAISDGMGSGEDALRESKATIDLLEKFLESGIDTETTIKLINSALILKSGSESFSTVDMCLVNLFTGILEFVKIGASTTYIKTQNSIEKINSSTLPIGILKDIDAEYSKKKLSDDNFVIMVSDGVANAQKDTSLKNDWITEYLSNLDTLNTQIIADNILKKAKNLCMGKADDDMTVLVSRIWKNK